MGRVSTKADLVAATVRDRDELLRLLASLSPEQLNRPGPYGWSAKDHVSHLSDWERLFMAWFDAGSRGEEQQLPAPGYNWATMDALNREMFLRHTGESYAQVMAEWQDSNGRMLWLLDWIPEPDLFAVGRYEWTGRGTLAAFADECGAKHYRWAATEIKRGLKSRR